MLAFGQKLEAIFCHQPHSCLSSPRKEKGRRGKRWVEKVDLRKTRYLRRLNPRVPSGPMGIRITLLGKPLPLGVTGFG